MSQEHGIEGDEPLFQFDSFEGIGAEDIPEDSLDPSSKLTAATSDLLDMSHIPLFSSLDLSAYTALSTPAEVVRSISMVQATNDLSLFDSPGEGADFKGKGKAVSQPMNIQQRDCTDLEFDSFTLPSSASGSSRGGRLIPVPSTSASTAQTSTSFACSPGVSLNFYYGSYETNLTSPCSSYTSDGVMKDINPDTEAENEVAEFRLSKGKLRAEPPVLPPLTFSPTNFTHGETNWPSSPRSPEVASTHYDYVDSAVEFPSTGSASGAQRDIASLETSLPAQRVPRTRSFSSLSTKSAKSLASRSVTKLKLSFSAGKRSNLARKLLLGKNDETDHIVLDLDEGAMRRTLRSSLSEPCSPYYTSGQLSFFDETEFCPSPNLFGNLLPREVKLAILEAFIDIYEEEGRELRRSQAWTANLAAKSNNRWTGRARGLIELVRLSSVAKDWQHLVFDGQLWVNLDLGAFDYVPPPLLGRLAAYSGSFIRTINLSGHTRLSYSTLIDMTKSMCIYNGNGIHDDIPITQLTHINLSGCLSITHHSLRYLLEHSPRLVSLKAKGLKAVTNETCQTLAQYCPLVQVLDLGRCHKMDSDGICAMMYTHRTSNTLSALKELRISGLRRINDHVLRLLGRYAPYLEVLDLSNASGLHNTALEALTSCPEDEGHTNVVVLTSREAGRDPNDLTKHRRRITRLRHLNLSSCALLTDTALTHLAHAVPKLEILELASIGAELRDDGLIHLLKTTPFLRRLDLDEACDITDDTLAAITPDISDLGSTNVNPPQPGCLLEHLTLSYAVRISNDAVMALIRACTYLKHLEVDSTRVSGATVKEFVRLCRKRQSTNAGIVIVDCRGVSENTVKELSTITRTRMGWRSWEARTLQYLDARDNESLGVGQDECDEKRVTLKSFYSWQTVDAVNTARQKRQKAEKKSGRYDSRYGDDSIGRAAKWWTPGGRRASGTTSPASSSIDRDREGCIIM